MIVYELIQEQKNLLRCRYLTIVDLSNDSDFDMVPNPTNWFENIKSSGCTCKSFTRAYRKKGRWRWGGSNPASGDAGIPLAGTLLDQPTRQGPRNWHALFSFHPISLAPQSYVTYQSIIMNLKLRFQLPGITHTEQKNKAQQTVPDPNVLYPDIRNQSPTFPLIPNWDVNLTALGED